MLTLSQKNFTLIFYVLLLLELICGGVESLVNWHYITKPLILISLIIFFWLESKSLNKQLRNFTLVALFFSLVGDILLMFVDRSPHYFTLGLVGFLIAHVFYCIAFNKFKVVKFKLSIISLLLIAYAFLLFTLIKNRLGAFLTPVVVYMLVILLMAQMAFLRRGNVNKLSFYLVFVGALFFLLSDSLIALNKFYEAFKHAATAIMLTYGIAQYLIVIGLLKYKNEV